MLDTYSVPGTSGGTGLILWKVSNQNNIKAILYTNVETAGVSVSYPSTSFTQYSLHHITITYGNGNMQLYVDGNLIGSSAYTGAVTAFNPNIYIGQRRSPLSGNLYQAYAAFDEFKVYGKKLTGQEMQDIRNKESGSYYLKLTNLGEGSYTFNAIATDTNNNQLNSETRTFGICLYDCDTGEPGSEEKFILRKPSPKTASNLFAAVLMLLALIFLVKILSRKTRNTKKKKRL